MAIESAAPRRRLGVHADHVHYKWWALSCTSLGMLLQNTGAVISIAFVLAVVTSSVDKDTLFAIFSGVTTGLSDAALEPFVASMHTALWVLAATSVVGTGICLLRLRGN